MSVLYLDGCGNYTLNKVFTIALQTVNGCGELVRWRPAEEMRYFVLQVIWRVVAIMMPSLQERNLNYVLEFGGGVKR